MKTKKLNVYRQPPKNGVDNFYPTSLDTFKQPALHLFVGQRTSGKSYLASKILAQHNKRTGPVTSLVTGVYSCNGLQGLYKACYKGACPVMVYKACRK